MRSVLIFAWLSFAMTSDVVSEFRKQPTSSKNVRSTSQMFDTARSFSMALQGLGDALGKEGYNVKAVRGAIKTFLPALKAAGPAFALLGSLTQGESAELKAINEGFGDVNFKLNVVQNELRNILNELKVSDFRSEYMQLLSAHQAVETAYHNFQSVKTPQTKQEFLRGCENYPSQIFLNHVYNYATASRDSNIFNMIIKASRYDRKQFLAAGKEIIRDAASAATLRALCITNEYNESHFSLIFTQNNDKLDEIGQRFFDWDEYMRAMPRCWIEKAALQDINELLDKYGDESYAAFGERLKNALTQKYDWLRWAVLVYKPVSGNNCHEWSGANAIAVLRTKNKNVFTMYSHYQKRDVGEDIYGPSGFPFKEFKDKTHTFKDCPMDKTWYGYRHIVPGADLVHKLLEGHYAAGAAFAIDTCLGDSFYLHVSGNAITQRYQRCSYKYDENLPGGPMRDAIPSTFQKANGLTTKEHLIQKRQYNKVADDYLILYVEPYLLFHESCLVTHATGPMELSCNSAAEYYVGQGENSEFNIC